MAKIVELKNVTKKFGGATVIDNASFDIKKGKIYGFIGPNGAGKTTLIKLILGILPLTSGEIQVFDKGKVIDSDELLANVGTIIGGPSFYGHLNAYQNMKIIANMKDVDITDRQIEEYLEIVGLGNVQKKKVRKFSLGMQQRLGIAESLIGEPDFLIWDEPINGLDPQGILEIRELIMRLRQSMGVTFLISSHILNELDKEITDTIVINKGRIIFSGECEEFLRQYDSESLEQAYLKCLEVGINL